MSAWDVAGAWTFTPLMLLYWGGFWTVSSYDRSDPKGWDSNAQIVGALCFGMILNVASVFPLARCFGAHL